MKYPSESHELASPKASPNWQQSTFRGLLAACEPEGYNIYETIRQNLEKK